MGAAHTHMPSANLRASNRWMCNVGIGMGSRCRCKQVLNVGSCGRLDMRHPNDCTTPRLNPPPHPPSPLPHHPSHAPAPREGPALGGCTDQSGAEQHPRGRAAVGVPRGTLAGVGRARTSARASGWGTATHLPAIANAPRLFPARQVPGAPPAARSRPLRHRGRRARHASTLLPRWVIAWLTRALPPRLLGARAAAAPAWCPAAARRTWCRGAPPPAPPLTRPRAQKLSARRSSTWRTRSRWQRPPSWWSCCRWWWSRCVDTIVAATSERRETQRTAHAPPPRPPRIEQPRSCTLRWCSPTPGPC